MELLTEPKNNAVYVTAIAWSAWLILHKILHRLQKLTYSELYSFSYGLFELFIAGNLIYYQATKYAQKPYNKATKTICMKTYEIT